MDKQERSSTYTLELELARANERLAEQKAIIKKAHEQNIELARMTLQLTNELKELKGTK